ncbi:MAG: hypothetical protein JW730_12435 [Anaerolineales bacterium]|nr:hypothetical protein [Anaerolineales bacterium]
MQIERTDIRKYFDNLKDRFIEDFYQRAGLIGQVWPGGLNRQATIRLTFQGR